MRKFIATLISGLYLYPAVTAQEAALFESTIIIEDSAGNKDSVVIGYDAAANAEYNPEFGEYDIPTPFDSVFEVRAAHYLSFNSHTEDIVLSKRIIGQVELSTYWEAGDCYLVTEPIILFVNAKHQPVTATWDPETFAGSYCLNRSIMTSHFMHLIIGPDWVEDANALALTACMAQDSQYTTDLFDYGSFGFWKYEDIQGVGMDTVYAIGVSFLFEQSPLTPCAGTVGDKYHWPSSDQMYILPNPASDYLYIKDGLSGQVEYHIFGVRGFNLLEGNGRRVNISALPPGVYIISMQSGDNPQIHTFVKH